VDVDACWRSGLGDVASRFDGSDLLFTRYNGVVFRERVGAGLGNGQGARHRVI
jgi:hypothetical protein